MTSDQGGGSITSVLQETRVFPPPAGFAKTAHISSLAQYEALWNRAKDDPQGFWAEQAKMLDWYAPWSEVLDWKPPFAKWFVGGKLNASYNCVDRHCLGPDRNKAAIVWEGEPGDRRVLRYQDLLREVSMFANVLKGLGIKKGDVVAVYMPLVPELVITLLACARIGAPHTVIFGGFSAESLSGRINDCKAKVLVTADCRISTRQARPLEGKRRCRGERVPTSQRCRRVQTNRDARQLDARPRPLVARAVANASADCPAESLDSEHPLYILYTSGSTGKPKGILHTTGGYLLGTALTAKWVFDLKDDDTFWCTADIGWVTGHSYLVYGPLANGATCVMYEGAPNWPDEGRFWKIIEDYQVSILYTAPTAIRAFMKWGEQFPRRHNLSSLRLLGTVGEPINPEAWMWYNRVIGGGRCPIVDTWWQTETGAMMISPLPGATPTVPGSATRPLPGIVPDIVTRDGKSCPPNHGGFLVIKQPWPSMLRTLYGDDERYKTQYWSDIPGCYFTGDGARRDENGNYWVLGRVDDVINVAGHRLSTMEVESALVSHPLVAEAAVVGKPDELKGQGIAAFVTLESGQEPGDALRQELRHTWPRRSEHSLALTRSGSPIPFRRPAAARSCAGCSETSPPASRARAIPRR